MQVEKGNVPLPRVACTQGPYEAELPCRDAQEIHLPPRLQTIHPTLGSQESLVLHQRRLILPQRAEDVESSPSVVQ